MKTKTIKAVLRKKVDEWLVSISDESVRALAAKDTIVTGGCIASMLLKESVNDFDVYFRTKATASAVANYYVKQFKPKQKSGIDCAMHVDDTTYPDHVCVYIKSAGVASENGTSKPYEYFEGSADGEASAYIADVMQDPGDVQDDQTVAALAEFERANADKAKYRPVFMSTNAITLSDKMQIVLRFTGDPDEIHQNYDFVHCTNYWTSNDGDLTLRQPALEAILARELRYVGSKYPIASIIRTRKFIKRNWSINAGQILKMVWQTNKLDLTDINVLRDQLTGVDVAYFAELISKIREKDPNKVNAAYLIEIIDRMF